MHRGRAKHANTNFTPPTRTRTHTSSAERSLFCSGQDRTPGKYPTCTGDRTIWTKLSEWAQSRAEARGPKNRARASRTQQLMAVPHNIIRKSQPQVFSSAFCPSLEFPMLLLHLSRGIMEWEFLLQLQLAIAGYRPSLSRELAISLCIVCSLCCLSPAPQVSQAAKSALQPLRGQPEVLLGV